MPRVELWWPPVSGKFRQDDLEFNLFGDSRMGQRGRWPSRRQNCLENQGCADSYTEFSTLTTSTPSGQILQLAQRAVGTQAGISFLLRVGAWRGSSSREQMVS